MSAPPSDRGPDGYRRVPGTGASIRADIIDVYVFRRAGGAPSAREVEILQLLRAKTPLDQTWQPVMGHVESGETCIEAAVRELSEEVGVSVDSPECLGFWALEQTYPYFVAPINAVVMSPRFCVEVAPGWEPRLNAEHSAARWIHTPYHGGQPAADFFLWPGQRLCVADLVRDIVPEDSVTRERLRVQRGDSPRRPGG